MARMRCFLAVELSPEVKERVVGLQTQLRRTLTGIKWVEEENLHVTLLFLGEVDEREIIKVCRLAQEAMTLIPSFTMTLQEFGCFPHARRPRVLWVGVGEGKEELVRIYEALATPLSELGYRREDRPYSPHITLGRTKSDGPVIALGQALEKFAAWEGGTMPVKEVVLMSSELTRDGPLYTVLGRAILGLA
jgi:RNA 2',3'-cyclic 3'-phosphodiesterase